MKPSLLHHAVIATGFSTSALQKTRIIKFASVLKLMPIPQAQAIPVRAKVWLLAMLSMNLIHEPKGLAV